MAKTFDVVVKVTIQETHRVEARSKADAVYQAANRDPDGAAEVGRTVAYVAEVKEGAPAEVEA